MNNRLNMQDLARLLSEHSGKDREAVECFLKEFVTVVTEGVYTDKSVKIKGLGIFKIILVEKRESIHVNTGERFLIPAHYKFSFLPDKDLREQVNKPFSFFETTEIGENVNFSDLDESVEEKDSEDESVEEVMPDREIPLVDTITVPDAEPQLEPVSEPVVEEEPCPEPVKPVSRKIIHKGTYLGIAAAIIVLICLAIIYIGKDRLQKMPARSVVAQTQDSVLTGDTCGRHDNNPDSLDFHASAKASKPKVLDSVKIAGGDRLTVIALKYYGHKLFWVYLYRHNQARIQDPNNVPIGTVIEIPSPELYGIDSDSRESRDKAALLQTEILTGK